MIEASMDDSVKYKSGSGLWDERIDILAVRGNTRNALSLTKVITSSIHCELRLVLLLQE